MVALASAFVRLRPTTDTAEFKREGEKAGAAAGKAHGDAFYRDSSGKLRSANGKFVSDSAKAGADGGKAFGDGFYRDAAGRVRKANGQFATDSEKAAAGYGSSSGKQYAKGFGGGVSGLKDQIKGSLSGAAALFVPLGLAAAAAEIGKIGMAYEDNLNILKAVTGATGAEMDAVAAKARALGADVQLPGVSAAGAAEAMTELAKAGFTVQQSMDAARGTLQLARVANMSEADAATIAANAVNAFGLAAKDTNFVVDELAAAANSSSLEISDASMSFKMAAAVFSSFQGAAVGPKEAITELNTAVAILGNNGIRGSDAGTSLKQMLLQLSGPTAQAKSQMALLAIRAQGATVSLKQQDDVLHGSKKVREAALTEIKKMNPAMAAGGDIAYDAAGKMRPLRDIIGLVTAGTKGLTQEERDFAITQIFGADASRSVIALMKGGLPVYDQMRQAITKQGAAAEFAAAKNAGLKGAIDNVKSQFENAAISIYNVVKGPLTAGLNGLANALPGFFAALGRVFSFIGDNRAIILGAAYALGVLTLAVKVNTAAMAVQAAGGLIAFFVQYAKATRLAAAGQVLLNLAQAASPIGLIVIAIGALVAAFVLAYKNSETFRNIVQGALNGIKVAAVAIGAFFTGTFLPAIKAVWAGIAAGATWLWQNVLRPVFTAVGAFFTGYVFPYFQALYTRVVQPVFRFIGQVISAWWAGTKVIFSALVAVLQNVVMPVIRFLYNNVFKPIFSAIGKAVEIWWFATRIVFAAFMLYLRNVIFPVIRFLYNNVFKPVFGFIGTLIAQWWRTTQFAFTVVKTAFSTLATAIRNTWERYIRPVLQALGTFIGKYIVPAFNAGASAIGKAWDRIKDMARKPIAFVVNHVVNPFIGGINRVGKAVGLKDKIAPIAGFASGGQIPGTPVFGRDNRLAQMKGTGKALAVASGEFITNTRSTLANLGLVRAINAKRGKVTHDDVDPYLDGYSNGGGVGDGIGDLFGKIKRGISGAAGAIADPKAALGKVADAALNRIPGGGIIRDIAAGAGRKLIGAIGSFISGAGIGGALGGQSVLGGWKGMQRLIAARFPGLGLISGPRPGARTLTGNRSYHASGRAVDYPAFRPLAAWIKSTFGSRTKELITPWQELNLHNGRPHTYTGAVWNQHNFAGGNAHVHWAARMGGLLSQMSGMPVRLFDQGGAWPSGTLGANLSGHTEFVQPGGQGGAGGFTITVVNEGVIGSQGEMDAWLAGSIKRLQREKKIPSIGGKR